jgi:uncharacterized membrane protein YedE/YeeE
MDPEVKRLIEETRAFAKENHDMLRAMRRNAWLGLIFQIVFWLVIIFAPVYFLLPYLGAMPSAAELQELLKAYQAQ